jgi:hypothetical protein
MRCLREAIALMKHSVPVSMHGLGNGTGLMEGHANRDKSEGIANA